MTNASLRLPAEWEPQSGILISFPHKNTDWDYMLDEAVKCFVDIAKAIVSDELLIIVTPHVDKAKEALKDIEPSKIVYYEIETNDTWARDFGGITILNNGKPIVCDFKFNGWGLKFASNHDNLITSKLNNCNAFNASYYNHLNFVLEGGSIESDGMGTILTTAQCLLSKNRNGAFSKEDIEQYLSNSLGAKQVLWLDHGALEGDDTDSHIDTLARLVPNDTIYYVGTDNEADSHYNELKLMEKQLHSFRTINGKYYNLIMLPLPSPIYDENGMRLPATYANFLIMNHTVLVPTYGQQENDECALRLIEKSFPNYKIIGIDCNALIKQHGSLHCVTMQFPKNVIVK
ncbi:MAG: agmatine deiminase family protein [Muribaculaceae bacterium]